MSGEAESLVFLLQTLKEEWRGYKNLKDGARHEFEQLIIALGELEAFLQDTAMMSKKSELFRSKESQIRELVYEVEDTIEICLTKAAAAKTKSIFRRFLGRFSTKMEEDVKCLNQQKVRPILNEIHNKIGVAKINHGSSSSLPEENSKVEKPSGQQFSPDQSIMQEKIVDFQDEPTIIGFLMESTQSLDIIAIAGMAGIGKTTFARKIFEHKAIVDKFQSRIWIHVSQKFNSTEAFRHILKEITRKDTFITSEGDLIASVRGSLKTKQFLLVMDDVWTEADWTKIKKILPPNNGKGKVLLTTRMERVASGANLMRPFHKLNTLSPNESLKLLKIQVYDSLEYFPKELEKVGQVVAEKCGGVPLIIMVIGGILRRVLMKTEWIDDVKEEWENVSTNVSMFLEKDEQKLISAALEMSYKRLDHDMRVCFLYTGLFPENHDIPVSTLTQLWIAEGFVRWKEGGSMEKSAVEILDTLITMNLLMVAKKNLDQVKACRVHDMIREFCRTKAMEEKLFRVIKRSNEGPGPLVAAKQDHRRLCFNSDPSDFPLQDLRDSRVRSLLCFYEISSNQDPVTLPDFNNFLRVLNCRPTKLQRFPEVKKLILLKHITLFIENLKELPEEISQLVNLQTLIVDTNLGSISVKVNIWKMIRLRRLKTKAAISLDGKNWKGKTRGNLQTVSRLSPASCKADLSKWAANLRKLGVRGILADLIQTMALADFPDLEKLKLINDVDDKSAASNPLVLTIQGCFPKKLKSLTLSKTFLKWDQHMPFLAKIDNLKVLKLKDNAFSGDEWVANEAVGFLKLQFLLIEKSEMVNWNASESYFPALRSLVIKNCEKLQEIPLSLAEGLATLEIDRVSKSVVDSAKKIAEKQTRQNLKSVREVPFKLTIGPGCDQALFSGIIKPME